MWETETTAERYALKTLAWMCEQYLDQNGKLDHECMSAGERALELLFHSGFVDSRGRMAHWTDKGQRFLDEATPMFD